jgi:HAD superfamily hydrolase (TIGR01509 family)
MNSFEAIIFDFDGVLLESELELNRLIAELLTDLGHPTTLKDALEHFVGLTGPDVFSVMERRIGAPLPPQFHEGMREAGARVLAEGLDPVAGAVEFVRALPPGLPKAVASSSSTRWIRTHLDHLGLADAFGPHIYSGKEHVARSKPAPDLYLHAARELGVAIERTVILEDSRIGAIGALASGATVIGVAAASHCLEGHEDMLRAVGVNHVAHSFDEVERFLGLAQTSRGASA